MTDQEDEVIEGVVYEVIDNECDTNSVAEGEVEGAQCYNLRRPRQQTLHHTTILTG